MAIHRLHHLLHTKVPGWHLLAFLPVAGGSTWTESANILGARMSAEQGPEVGVRRSLGGGEGGDY